MTLLEVAQRTEADADDEALRDLIRELKRLADAAWDAAADLSHGDIIRSYERGKAHAFCAVLGDQAALGQMGYL